MRYLLLSFIVFVVGIVSANYQSVTAKNVTDDDRRGFENLSVIKIDVDGDGIKDDIKPRSFQVKPKKKTVKLSEIQNWIVFDLSTSKGLKLKSFFKYKYGTAEQGGSYWVYALISAGDFNNDGKTDLLFYSGDDTSDESVWLATKTNGYSVFKRKISNSEDW